MRHVSDCACRGGTALVVVNLSTLLQTFVLQRVAFSHDILTYLVIRMISVILRAVVLVVVLVAVVKVLDDLRPCHNGSELVAAVLIGQRLLLLDFLQLGDGVLQD